MISLQSPPLQTVLLVSDLANAFRMRNCTACTFDARVQSSHKVAGCPGHYRVASAPDPNPNTEPNLGPDLQVTYRMRPFAVLREPALLIGTVALVFFLIIAWLRLDLTITRDAAWAAGQKRAQAAATAQKLVAVLAGAHISACFMVATVEANAMTARFGAMSYSALRSRQ